MVGIPPISSLPAGLPPLALGAASLFGTNASLLLSDVALIYQFFQGPQWGIFDQNNQPVLIGDSVKAAEFDKFYSVPDYQVEQGGFESYNKVELPFDVVITLTKGGAFTFGGAIASVQNGALLGALAGGGSVGDRSNFLTEVASVVASLDLFNVATPEVTFQNVNLIRFNYRRTAHHGASLLTVNIFGKQIRTEGQLQFSNTQAPDGAAQQNGGTVQPSTPDKIPNQVT